MLSAQTAITHPRDFYATALRNYTVACFRRLHTTGEDMARAAGK